MKDLSLLKILEVGLLAFIVLAPLQNRDIFSFFGTRLFPVRLVLIALISITSSYYIFHLIKKGSITEGVKKGLIYLWRDQLLRALLILLTIRVVSLRSTPNFKASLSLLLFFTSMVALYILIKYLNEKRPNFLSRAFHLHLVIVSLVGIYGFLEFLLVLTGHRLPGVLTGGTFVRIPATFYDANHLPAYLITGLPLILISAFYIKNEVYRTLTYLVVLILSFVIFMTYSRSGMIGFSFVFSSIFIYLLVKRYWRKLSFLVLCIILASTFITITASTNYSLIKRLGSVVNVEDKSTVAHGLLLYGSIKVWQDNPIFGVGYGGFSEAFRATDLGREHAYFDPAVGVRLPVHSIWLEVLTETGLLGFVTYVSLMLLIAEAVFKAFKVLRDKKSKLNQLALGASFGGLLISGVFYSYNLEFLWFFLFLLYLHSSNIISGREREGSAVELETEPVKWREIYIPLCLFIFFASVIFLGITNVDLKSSEGVFALTAKTTRRAFGYSWPNPAFPRLQEEDKFLISYQPFFFYLNAFSFFLYDLGNFSVRVWSGILGVFSLLFFYFIGRRTGRSVTGGVLFSLIISVLPGFLALSRSAESTVSVYFFLSLILLSFLTFSESFISKLALFFGVFFFPLIRQDFLFLIPVFLILGLFKNIFSRKSFIFILSAYLISLFITFSWLRLTVLATKANNLSPFFYEGIRMLPEDLKIILLIVLAFYLVSFLLILRVRKLTLLLLLIVLSVTIININLEKSSLRDRLNLITKRLDFNRNGRIPLYVYGPVSNVDNYYSEVFILPYSENDVFRNLVRDQELYTIIDGGLLNQLSQENIRSSPLLEFSSVSGRMILVHQFGKIL